ncbi:MFS transporter [Streptomyces odontomachi]|uniref:MFS transporter n=1 Tax=Streptomyces odontomachi TaxID=2944940 RepID=UPI002109B5E5|nr:MFS transporter [Streptomyces sp. ODS25]
MAAPEDPAGRIDQDGPVGRAERRRTVVAASAGNFAEWYDWGVYGVVATVVADKFFPPGNDTLALLSAYAVFAISYLTRPLGATVFGHIGDKLGRKRALSTTIIITCGATALIGFIPTYAVIGYAAPVLLLLMRLIQSFGTGGEYSTAISFVYEHGQKGRKATAVGMMTAMTFGGFIVGSLLATLLSATLSSAAYEAWGWRLLFWLSLPMGVVGLYLRRRTAEGREFRQLLEAQEQQRERHKRQSPVWEALRTHGARILVFVAFLGTWAIISATMTSYLATFLKGNSALSGTQSYGINTLNSVMVVVCLLAFCPVADRIGLRRATIVGSLVVAVGVVPGFALASSGVTAAWLGGALLGLCKGVMAVPSLLAVSQIFPAHIRVTAGGLSYNVAQALLGGTAPLIGVWLNSVTGSALFFSSYLVLAALVTLVITLVCGRRWIADSESHSGDAGSTTRDASAAAQAAAGVPNGIVTR